MPNIWLIITGAERIISTLSPGMKEVLPSYRRDPPNTPARTTSNSSRPGRARPRVSPATTMEARNRLNWHHHPAIWTGGSAASPRPTCCAAPKSRWSRCRSTSSRAKPRSLRSEKKRPPNSRKRSSSRTYTSLPWSGTPTREPNTNITSRYRYEGPKRCGPISRATASPRRSMSTARGRMSPLTPRCWVDRSARTRSMRSIGASSGSGIPRASRGVERGGLRYDQAGQEGDSGRGGGWNLPQHFRGGPRRCSTRAWWRNGPRRRDRSEPLPQFGRRGAAARRDARRLGYRSGARKGWRPHGPHFGRAGHPAAYRRCDERLDQELQERGSRDHLLCRPWHANPGISSVERPLAERRQRTDRAFQFQFRRPRGRRNHRQHRNAGLAVEAPPRRGRYRGRVG